MIKTKLLFFVFVPLIVSAPVRQVEDTDSQGWPFVSVLAPFEAATMLLGASIVPSLSRHYSPVRILLAVNQPVKRSGTAEGTWTQGTNH